MAEFTITEYSKDDILLTRTHIFEPPNQGIHHSSQSISLTRDELRELVEKVKEYESQSN